MARSPRRVLVTLALAAGLALGTAGAAAAETLAVNDKRGDLVSASIEDDHATTPRPGVGNGDIVRTVIRHTADRVSVRVRFAELRKAGEMRGDALVIVTNEGVRREVSTWAAPRMWRGESEMTRPNGEPVSCAVRHRMNYDLDVVTVSFPRACVSNPRWVRVGFGSFWMNGEDEFFADDALRHGEVTDTLALSSRLSRG